MPALIRLYIRNIAIGFALSVLFVGLLIGFDVAGLRHLVLATDGGLLAVLLLVVFNGIVFAGVQFGIAVMGLAEDDRRGGGTGRALTVAEPVPVPVAAGMKRREPRQP